MSRAMRRPPEHETENVDARTAEVDGEHRIQGMDDMHEVAERRWFRGRAVRWVIVLGVLAGAVLLSAARRPDEFASPYLWDEEGVILSRWMHEGWSLIFSPVSGDL